MTARLYRTEPCWLVDNDPWESWHFDTEAKAIANADKALAKAIADDPEDADEHRRAPVSHLQHPCWLVTCDHPECDEEDEGEYEMGAVHHEGEHPPTLDEGAKPGEWLCPEHAPEPKWLRRVNAGLKAAGL